MRQTTVEGKGIIRVHLVVDVHTGGSSSPATAATATAATPCRALGVFAWVCARRCHEDGRPSVLRKDLV